MRRFVFQDEVGAVTADWITLTVGIVVLGLMVAFSVMNSTGYLMSEFDDLNDRFATSGGQDEVAASSTSAAASAASALTGIDALRDASASEQGQGASDGSADPGSRIPDIPR